jgi:hypothetical protein
MTGAAWQGNQCCAGAMRDHERAGHETSGGGRVGVREKNTPAGGGYGGAGTAPHSGGGGGRREGSYDGKVSHLAATASGRGERGRQREREIKK